MQRSLLRCSCHSSSNRQPATKLRFGDRGAYQKQRSLLRRSCHSSSNRQPNCGLAIVMPFKSTKAAELAPLSGSLPDFHRECAGNPFGDHFHSLEVILMAWALLSSLR